MDKFLPCLNVSCSISHLQVNTSFSSHPSVSIGPVIMDYYYVIDILIEGEDLMGFQTPFYCFKTFIKISLAMLKK